jgi:hypothetical protein
MCVVFFLYHHSSAIPLNLPLFLTSFVQARLSPLPNYVTMHDCIAIFSKFDVKTVKKDTVIITGKRTTNGLWEIPLATTSHQANGILRLDKSKAELAMYYHATLGSPAPSTPLLRAIRHGHLTTFPSLTTQLITKHLPKSLATVLGLPVSPCSALLHLCATLAPTSNRNSSLAPINSVPRFSPNATFSNPTWIKPENFILLPAAVIITSLFSTTPIPILFILLPFPID